jgi:hypothetical protein
MEHPRVPLVVLKKESHGILTILKCDVLIESIDTLWEIVDWPFITGMSLKDVDLAGPRNLEKRWEIERGVTDHGKVRNGVILLTKRKELRQYHDEWGSGDRTSD